MSANDIERGNALAYDHHSTMLKQFNHHPDSSFTRSLPAA